MDEYVIVAGRKLRKGYTTGTCAAAASKAVVSMIVTGKLLEKVNIVTPLEIPVIMVERLQIDYGSKVSKAEDVLVFVQRIIDRGSEL